ncbi:MAG: hypothetical protein KME21_14295 [Desmonostoc vinosum HA7617-LM4]|nr:hypothetical protein [Desmonostoc vinosum HA7617-LM4]
MKPFVGVGKELFSRLKLQSLITKLAIEPSYYFLRWTHKVSGIREEQPTEIDFPMMEGQMFNHKYELRWKLQHNNLYDVLLLSIAGDYSDFTPVGHSWKIEPNNQEKFPYYAYPAYGYPRNEVRFPKEFIYSKTLNVRIEENDKSKPVLAQRYFIDGETSAVQFVALTLEGEHK